MSPEGYTSAVRPRMEEIAARMRQATLADEIATRLVQKYAYYNTAEDNNPLQTPEINWDEASPTDLVYMKLYNGYRQQIHGAGGSDPREAHYLVKRAEFIFGNDNTIFGRVFSVSVNSIEEPPYVLGLENTRLEAPEIEQVIVDLARYERALGSRSQQ